MSWLFPEFPGINPALESNVAELELAMEGALSAGFSKRISAKKEMKPHRAAMKSALRSGDYATAYKEAKTCAEILRKAANEIKALDVSSICNLIVDIAVFAMLEIVEILLLSKLGKHRNMRTTRKYNKRDFEMSDYLRKSGTDHLNDVRNTDEYREVLKIREELSSQGIEVEDRYIAELTHGKILGNMRDKEIKANNAATRAEMGMSVLVNALGVIYKQTRKIKKIKNGEITPAEANGLLGICIRSLNQSADSYEAKAAEYKRLAG